MVSDIVATHLKLHQTDKVGESFGERRIDDEPKLVLESQYPSLLEDPSYTKNGTNIYLQETIIRTRRDITK